MLEGCNGAVVPAQQCFDQLLHKLLLPCALLASLIQAILLCLSITGGLHHVFPLFLQLFGLHKAGDGAACLLVLIPAWSEMPSQ